MHDLLAKAQEAAHLFAEEHESEPEVPFSEIEAIANEVGIALGTMVGLVKGYGLKIGKRAIVREVRGFKSNPHDRWYGKGSSPTHGGSGWEQITGFAGQNG